MSRDWVHGAIARIEADFTRSADTHLIRLELPATPGITLYLKDESDPPDRQPQAPARPLALPLRALQWLARSRHHGRRSLLRLHRRLRGLFREAHRAALHRRDAAQHLAREDRARSSSTAEAATSSPIPARSVPRAPASLPSRGGHFMDQFTFAERATDWRGNNNIAEAVFRQMTAEPHPIPRLDRLRRRHRRHLGHLRPLHPLPPPPHAPLRGRPRAFGLPSPPRRPRHPGDTTARPPASRASAAPASSPPSCLRSSTA